MHDGISVRLYDTIILMEFSVQADKPNTLQYGTELPETSSLPFQQNSTAHCSILLSTVADIGSQTKGRNLPHDFSVVT